MATEHIHVSERAPGPWVLCTECSAVMWQRATGQPVPANRAEACKLRKAETANRSCDEGGSTIALLKVGMKRLWNRDTPAAIAGFETLWRALSPGTAAIVLGSPKDWPVRLRRHDPHFTGKHAVEVERRDEQDRVWLDDPLGPVDGYDGEWITKAELQTFVRAWPGARHLVARMVDWSGGGNQPGDDVAIPVAAQLPIGATVDVPKNHTLYSSPGVKAGEAASAGPDTAALFGSGTGYVGIDWRGELRLVTGLPVTLPPVAPPGGDRYLAGRQDEYDAVLAGIGIPPRP